MTQKPAVGRPQKDIRIKIGVNNWEKQCSNVEFPEPDGATVRWQGGTPDAVLADTTAGQSVCNITLVQAWDEEDSLCNFMFDHAGEAAVIEYKPHAEMTWAFVSAVTLIKPTIGGKVNQFNESTIALPCTPPVKVED